MRVATGRERAAGTSPCPPVKAARLRGQTDGAQNAREPDPEASLSQPSPTNKASQGDKVPQGGGNAAPGGGDDDGPGGADGADGP